MKYLMGVLLLGLLLSSCQDDEVVDPIVPIDVVDPIDPVEMECVFEQDNSTKDGEIDEEERRIMDECYENRFLTAAEIEENIIGDWKLIGHGEGWVLAISEPCASISFTENEAVFQFTNEYVDTLVTLEWSMNEAIIDYGEASHEGLRMGFYSEKYMFSDNTAFDGNMYLYQKVD